jgi:ribonuclease HI
LGSQTNYVAVYAALIWGLENVSALGFSDVSVFADSELLVKQINGQYRVKNEGLKPLFVRTLQVLRSFTTWKVSHVRREQNAEADAMANDAMDSQATVGDPACEPGGSTQDSLF